jgi:hypothetical protein
MASTIRPPRGGTTFIARGMGRPPSFLMVRRRVSAVSNHEAPIWASSFETLAEASSSG